MLLRHVPFLKAVFIYALTAFGGPQAHIGMMVKTFVHRRKDVTEEELIEYNSFCQMLPGPSSTQTVMLIAFKRGGIPLSLVTLAIWVAPATVLMSVFSFVLYYAQTSSINVTPLLRFIQPMSVGFLTYAAARMMQWSIRHPATWAIMIGAIIATVSISSPWIFPLTLVAAGITSNFSNKRIPNREGKPHPIRWLNLWLFGFLFTLAGVLSELARVGDWTYRRAFNLFENFYRFGAIVFGGGQALLPMMLYQFVNLPASHNEKPLISSEALATGYGLVQAVPGPVFSISSFVGGTMLAPYGPLWQALGCIMATVAVFIPSTLLLFFLFPLYQNLKQHVVIYRALEGINAAVTGIVWASGFVLFRLLPVSGMSYNVPVMIITFLLLFFTRVPSPLLVVGWLLLGWAIPV
jgi:chromate transporter